jgi:hypothetical protein
VSLQVTAGAQTAASRMNEASLCLDFVILIPGADPEPNLNVSTLDIRQSQFVMKHMKWSVQALVVDQPLLHAVGSQQEVQGGETRRVPCSKAGMPSLASVAISEVVDRWNWICLGDAPYVSASGFAPRYAVHTPTGGISQAILYLVLAFAVSFPFRPPAEMICRYSCVGLMMKGTSESKGSGTPGHGRALPSPRLPVMA